MDLITVHFRERPGSSKGTSLQVNDAQAAIAKFNAQVASGSNEVLEGLTTNNHPVSIRLSEVILIAQVR